MSKNKQTEVSKLLKQVQFLGDPGHLDRLTFTEESLAKRELELKKLIRESKQQQCKQEKDLDRLLKKGGEPQNMKEIQV